MLFWVQCRNPAILPPNDNIRIVNVEFDRENADYYPLKEAVELFGGRRSDWIAVFGPEEKDFLEVRADGMLVYSRETPISWRGEMILRAKGDEVLSHG